VNTKLQRRLKPFTGDVTAVNAFPLCRRRNHGNVLDGNQASFM